MKDTSNISTPLDVNELVSLHGDEMFRWCLFKIGDKETAEDIVQETFLAAFRSRDKFKSRSEPKTWLFSIMKNKIIDHHRRKFKEATVNSSTLAGNADEGDFLDRFFDSTGSWVADNSPSDWQRMEASLLDDPEFNSIFSDCLNNLPTNWFSAIQLKYLEEKGGKEICQELGISPTNFWQILHRAKVKLRECLNNNWFNS